MAYSEINYETEFGTVSGYISNLYSDRNLLNYLEDLFPSKEEVSDIIEMIKKETANGDFTILKNIKVDEDFRKQGHGSELMTVFIDESVGPIICVADAHQEQIEDFSLHSFYVGFGFEKTNYLSNVGYLYILKN